MRREIESTLAKFHAIQTEELNESVCKIMSCLENTEQVILMTVSGRASLLKL